ncbi:MAG: DUF5916 domain-containing protein [Gemmatimonadaceae bacterium]
MNRPATTAATLRSLRTLGGGALALLSLVSYVQPSHAQAFAAHAAQSGSARERNPRSLSAVRVTDRIRIDGRIDEAAWRAATVGSDFVQRTPDVLQPASQRTEVRMLIDDAALYVAIRLHDSAPDSIIAPLGRRDAELYSDWAQVLIDAYHDKRTAFRFMVNPAGVQRDGVISEDDEFTEDLGWDAVWSSAARVDSAGWTAELRIPLSQLRFSVSADGATRWGLQIGRQLARRDERSYWSPIAPNVSGFVSQFGTLDSVRVPRPARRVEVMPYLSSRITRAPVEIGNPVQPRSALDRTAGADIRLGVTQELTLTGTINPDFGQVEADPSEVNLTSVESFFGERRPFFLEGSSLFGFDMVSNWWTGREELFYSRRIGRAPQGDSPDDARWIERPSTTPVLGALKLSGRTAGGWKIAALGALTGDARASYVDPRGQRATSVIEPRTRSAVVRVTRDLTNEGSIGSVLTVLDRDESIPTLRNGAVVGGVDGRVRFGGRKFELFAYALGSMVRGSPEAIIATQQSTTHLFQRPDASYLGVDSSRTSLGGISSILRLTKVGGGHTRGGIYTKVVTPGFEANDLGLQPRADFINANLWMGWDGFESNRFVRNWESWFVAWTGSSFGGDRERFGQRLYGRAMLHSSWELESYIERHASLRSLTALRGGPVLTTPASLGGFARVASDRRRAVTADLMVRVARDDEGPGRSLWLAPSLATRVGGNTQLSVAPSLSWWRNPQQFVASVDAADGTHHVVSDLLQSSAAVMLRASYALSSRLSFQLYAQPFVSAGEYRQLGEVVAARAPTFDQRVRLFSPESVRLSANDQVDVRRAGGLLSFGRPDYSFAELRSNAVMRWEYRPGSTLFVVWSQGRTLDGEPEPFDVGGQSRELLRLPSTNVLLVKVSHWLGR